MIFGNWNDILIWIIRILYIFALLGLIVYIPSITGNRLDASEQELGDMKLGIRRKGLRHYLSNGVLYTLFLALAELLNQNTLQPVNLKTYYVIMALALGFVNLYVSLYRTERLALDAEVSLVSRYKIAFAILGIINLVMAIVGYLVG